MQEYEINRNSWHFKWLALFFATKHYFTDLGFSEYSGSYTKFYDDYCVKRPYNFCMYWRHVLLYPALHYAVTVITTYIFIMIWMSLISIITLSSTFFAIAAVSAFFAIFLIIAICNMLIRKFFNKATQLSQNSNNFIATTYKVYKNKYCPGVKYVKDD